MRFILAIGIFAVTGVRLMAGECGELSTPKAVIDCVLQMDPRISISAERVRAAEGRARAAGTWSNPEVEGEYVRSENGAEEKIGASLSQRIDWGSRAGAARAEWEAEKARHVFLRQEIAGETVLRLVRLGQIAEETTMIEGQLGLCGRGLQRLGKLAFLTAEQKAGKQALEWSRERLELEKLELEAEAEEIRAELSLGLGGREVPAGLALPHKEEWPPFPAPASGTPTILKVEALGSRAAQERSGAEASSAWPSLSLGPVFEREGAANFFGGRISLELPLFDRNEGNREEAKAQAREAGIREKEAKARLDKARKMLRDRYVRAVGRLEALDKTLDGGDSRLSAIRADYLEGRVSLPLALEVYRELEELLEKFHSTERAAYAALWRGYALEDLAEGMEP